MSSFFEIYNQKGTSIISEENAESILKELCAEITKNWMTTDHIIATLLTTSGNMSNNIVHAVHLTTPNENNYYSYRYIEVIQPIDKPFDVEVSAFQNPPTPFGKANDAISFRKILTAIIGDDRTRVLQKNLKQISTFE